MFRKIFPNRWFIWTLVIIFATLIYVEGEIVKLEIEQQTENLITSGSLVSHKINKDPIVDTSLWKTYRNEKYGFEFKYPGDWPSELTALIDGNKKGGYEDNFSFIYLRDENNLYAYCEKSYSNDGTYSYIYVIFPVS